MKLSEILEKSDIIGDTKARRVLNISNDIANITADQIEDGVTIEALETINVPVLKYASQLTIHGKLPQYSEFARPAGYKSIITNGNGSVGVRYVAIDGAKKKLIRQASRYSDNRMFNTHIDSQGLILSAWFKDKEPAIDAYKNFPDNLIIGSKTAGKGFYGGYYVIVFVGAIYQVNLWNLINTLYGIPDQAALDTLVADEEEKHRLSNIAFQENQKKQQELQAKKVATLKTELNGKMVPLTQIPAGNAEFIRLNNAGELFFYVLRKRPFGLCYFATRYKDGMTLDNITIPDKLKKYDKIKAAGINKSLQAGNVFKA